MEFKFITLKELREKDLAGLKQLEFDVAKELFTQQVKKAAGALKDTSQFSRLRRYTAKIKTIMAEKKGAVKC